MAKRPVFIVSDNCPYVIEKDIEFQFYSGFSIKQKQKSIKSLHDAFLQVKSVSKVLEISSKSESELGVKLSAFNLMIKTKSNKEYSVEMAFQASKVFENGGPYIDILEKSSKEAKKDIRLKNSGRLKYFYFNNRKFELTPTTYFYNWLYVNTLNLYPDLADMLMEYDAFTDIEFNPDRSINCQARAAAVYVSLRKNGILNQALENNETFLNVVYGKTYLSQSNMDEQITIWDKFL